MKIVLSTHFDVAKPVSYIKLDDKNLLGLVDNFAGIFTAYQASRKTGTLIYLTNFEESPGYAGACKVAALLDKETLVIVVDTCTDAERKAAYIGNAYKLNMTPLKKQFRDKILFKDGFYEQDMDETWIYGKKFGLKTFYFGVPVPKDYHDTDNKVALKTIDKAGGVLVQVIQWLQKNPK
ncbi:MAG: hypothetical protein HY377_00145 [Candidatus Blackburnbacteria bacterium]|nr:hypothetical protein [Candidatus Blackburnbacteria bacterium]